MPFSIRYFAILTNCSEGHSFGGQFVNGAKQHNLNLEKYYELYRSIF